MPRSGGAAPGVSPNSGTSAFAEIVRRAVLLQEFRHHVLAEHQVGEDDRRQPVLIGRPISVLERRHLVGRDHRHAGERELERHGAGFGQCRAGDAERRALLRRFDHDPRHASASPRSPPSPARQAAAASAARSRPARPGRRPAQMVSPNVADQALDFAAPAARQDQQDRRLGEPPLRLVRRSAAALPTSSSQRMADIGAGRPAEPRDAPPARTAATPARGRHSRASRARARAARPRPTATHSRRSGSRARRRARACATRWVNSGTVDDHQHVGTAPSRSHRRSRGCAAGSPEAVAGSR